MNYIDGGIHFFLSLFVCNILYLLRSTQAKGQRQHLKSQTYMPKFCHRSENRNGEPSLAQIEERK